MLYLEEFLEALKELCCKLWQKVSLHSRSWSVLQELMIFKAKHTMNHIRDDCIVADLTLELTRDKLLSQNVYQQSLEVT